LEPVEESLPEENGLASAEDDEDGSSDAENNGACSPFPRNKHKKSGRCLFVWLMCQALG
jgi:hypothetical protein